MKASKISLFSLLFIFIMIACQEYNYDENTTDQIDEDMSAATLLADEHQVAETGRKNRKGISITVFKYKSGTVYFDTNTDDYKGYQVLEETSITAVVEPGEYVFWFAGSGIDDLEDVIFDEDSQSYLEENPVQYKSDKMWVLKMPSNYDPSHEFLKYDIIYLSKDNEEYIRLDPKIQIQN